MIYRKAHIADCARHTGAVFPIVLAVCTLIFLSRLLAESVADALPLSSLGRFLMLIIIKYMPQLLTVSLFAGIVLAVGRAFQRREMTVWFSSGIGLRHFVTPGALFALPTIAAIAVASLYASPWSVRAADALRAQLLNEVNPQNIRAGIFGTTPGGSYTYYFNGDSTRPDNIFIIRNSGNTREIITTRSARREKDSNGEFITLQEGTLYRLPLAANKDAPPEITAFDSMQVFLSGPRAAGTRPRGAPLKDLSWDTPAARAEIIWRINQPLAALFFVLLAPLVGGSYARFGQGRGMSLAVLLFVIYLNLLYYARDGVASGDLHFIPAMLLAPCVVFLTAFILRRPPVQ